jgi:hypothetical protein
VIAPGLGPDAAQQVLRLVGERLAWLPESVSASAAAGITSVAREYQSGGYR